MSRRQCKKCPWKVGVDPRTIPDGYSETRHAALAETCQSGLASFVGPMKAMACHEYPPGAEKPCVGWLVNQLGPGNNIALRMAVRAGRIDADVKTVGPQHPTFDDTLPRSPA
jgi:hypothetical protein